MATIIGTHGDDNLDAYQFGDSNDTIKGQCHQDKAFLRRSLNIQNGFGSILSCPIKWR